MFSINTNIPAMNAARNANLHRGRVATALQRLSSGLRINSAKDDPSGLAMAQKMRASLTGLEQSERNKLDELSKVQTQDGVAAGMQSIVQRMSELATRATNGTISDTDRKNIDLEYQELLRELARQKQTDYNGMDLFNKGASIKGGDNNSLEELEKMKAALELLNDKETTYEIITKDGKSILKAKDTGGLYGLEGTSLATLEDAQKALEATKSAVDRVSTERADYGATMNRIEYSLDNLTNSQVNLAQALSRIQDADMAKEMTNYVRESAAEQAANFVMSQAMQRPGQMLSMLQSMMSD